MELAEIQSLIVESATENEIDIETLLTYNISLSIDNYNKSLSNIIDDIDRDIVIDKSNKIIYLNIDLY